MARKAVTQFFDDLTGEAIPADDARTVKFSYSGVSYSIDLSPENAEKLLETFTPWIKVATRVTSTRPTSKPAKRSDLHLVREWARDNGFEVSERGRVPRTVLDAYDNRKSAR